MLGFTGWLPPADPKVGEKISNLGPLTSSDILTLIGTFGPMFSAILVSWHYRGAAGVKALLARMIPPRIAPQHALQDHDAGRR